MSNPFEAEADTLEYQVQVDPGPTFLIIPDVVKIDLVTGDVELLKPANEAAKEFWAAVGIRASGEDGDALFHAITQNVRVGKMIYLWPEERPSGPGSWEKVGPVLNRLQGWLRIA